MGVAVTHQAALITMSHIVGFEDWCLLDLVFSKRDSSVLPFVLVSPRL